MLPSIVVAEVVSKYDVLPTSVAVLAGILGAMGMWNGIL